jgi:hypothetical protein
MIKFRFLTAKVDDAISRVNAAFKSKFLYIRAWGAGAFFELSAE